MVPKSHRAPADMAISTKGTYPQEPVHSAAHRTQIPLKIIIIIIIKLFPPKETRAEFLCLQLSRGHEITWHRTWRDSTFTAGGHRRLPCLHFQLQPLFHIYKPTLPICVVFPEQWSGLLQRGIQAPPFIRQKTTGGFEMTVFPLQRAPKTFL